MSEACDQLDSRSRKNLASILNGLGKAGQTKVAEVIQRDESTVSKMKDKEIPQLARMLAACGLKVVPVEMRCFDPKKIEAILQLAKSHLAEMDNSERLAWDE